MTPADYFATGTLVVAVVVIIGVYMLANEYRS